MALFANSQARFTYRITTPWMTVYFGTFILTMAAFFTRSQTFWDDTPGISTAHIGQHASNFALSYVIVLASSLLGLLVDGPHAMRRTYLIGGIFVVANIVCELFMPFLNTRDIIDMIYGIVGTVCAVAVLWLMQRFGLRRL